MLAGCGQLDGGMGQPESGSGPPGIAIRSGVPHLVWLAHGLRGLHLVVAQCTDPARFHPRLCKSANRHPGWEFARQ